jgi:hypothetical protein
LELRRLSFPSNPARRELPSPRTRSCPKVRRHKLGQVASGRFETALDAAAAIGTFLADAPEPPEK